MFRLSVGFWLRVEKPAKQNVNNSGQEGISARGWGLGNRLLVSVLSFADFTPYEPNV